MPKINNGLLENTGANVHELVERLVLQEKPRVILDIPCGEGAFSRRIIEKGVKSNAADCENIMKFNGAPFVIADMNKALPYEDSFFDGVVCIDGIEHIERPFDFIRECRRIVKPGGFLIISMPNISSLRSRWRYLLTGFHNGGKAPLDEANPSPLHHITLATFPELRYRLETNGFTITKITTNQIKAVSWLYLILVPFVLIRTLFVFFIKEAPNESRKKINKVVFKNMLSIPVLFGAGLIVKAKKVA